MINSAHDWSNVTPHTHAKSRELEGTELSESPAIHETPAAEPEAKRPSVTESVIDNLSAWTVVALVIGILYIVWATLEILDKYVGGLPAVTP